MEVALRTELESLGRQEDSCMSWRSDATRSLTKSQCRLNKTYRVYRLLAVLGTIPSIWICASLDSRISRGGVLLVEPSIAKVDLRPVQSGSGRWGECRSRGCRSILRYRSS